MTRKNNNFLAHSIGLAVGAAMILSCACLPVYADSDSADPNVPKLETKFFEHTYPKDPLPQRLERIEKMVFGEARTGSDGERLAKLILAVPNLSDVTVGSSSSSSPASTASSDAQDVPIAPSKTQDDVPLAPSRRTAKGPDNDVPLQSSRKRTAQAPEDVVAGTKYPQVSAMEQKVLGKDYAAEPVDNRLARLEQKVFGKPSSLTDLSERVDRLKQSTGIDITKQAPAGADWADEEDNTFMPPPVARRPEQSSPAGSYGEDGKSFSGRDLRQDMSKAFPGRSSGSSADQDIVMGSGPSGLYGRGASSSSSSSSGATGFYGFGGGGNTYTPRRTAAAPPMVAPGAIGGDTSGAMGLNQKVSALETEVLSKTYTKDTLPVRVSRLEEAVFPKDKAAWAEKPLPDRVDHLVSVIPISAPQQVSRNRHVAQSSNSDPDFPDMDVPNMPSPAPQRTGGLSKIINSIGNMMGGGYNSGYGGYGMSGTMVRDPQTGLLMDSTTGNLIDPSSGMVIGRRVVQPNYGYGGVSPYGGMGGINSFGNGFSPYGMGNSMGGSGVRFGVGGMSGGRMGMWP